MKMTRRGLTKLALAATAAAQTDDELKTARENLRRRHEVLAQVKVPTETEPAFQFKP